MGKKKEEIITRDGPTDPKAEMVGSVDQVIKSYEAKYGFGRLLMATPDLDLVDRVKAQRERYNRAVYEGTPADVQKHGQSVIAGYGALEAKYLAAGFTALNPAEQQEALLPDGSVLVIVPSVEQYVGDGRQAICIGADVVGMLWDEKTRETLGQMAKHFPGAKIEAVRDKRPVGDEEIPF